jgi:hypothetical protein
MSDISDLRGVYPTHFRWNAEDGVASYWPNDETVGERVAKAIELDSPAAKFVMDFATRERGYGKLRLDFRDMILTPVGSPPPPWPDDEDYKPAVATWLWNPILGELRLESNGAIFRGTISDLWDRCRTFKEASQDLQPVIHFVDRQERFVKAVGKGFWTPVINIVGWVEREKVPTFRLREPTVPPPAASPILEDLRAHVQDRLGKPAGSPDADLDDEIPW